MPTIPISDHKELKTRDVDCIPAGVGNTEPVIKLGPDRNIQNTEKTPFVQQTVDLQGNKLQRSKCLAPRSDNSLPVNTERVQIYQLKSQFEVVSSLVLVADGHTLIASVNLKDKFLNSLIRSLPPFILRQLFEQLLQSCRVNLRENKLQRSKCLAPRPDNRLPVNTERDQIYQLNPQFDFVSSIVYVINWHGLIVAVKLKDGFLVRLVEVRSLHRYPSRFSNQWRQFFEQLTNFCIDLPVCRVNKNIGSGGQDATQTLLCIKEICKDNSNLDLAASSLSQSICKQEDTKIQLCPQGDSQYDCNSDECLDRLEEARCLRLFNYWSTFLIQLLKSFKAILHNKGIVVVICLLLVIVVISGAQPSNRACSVSSHLEVIPSGSLQVGKGMKLICRHNGCEGIPRWDQDKPIGRQLTFNGNVQSPHKQTIDLEINGNEYNIILQNVTLTEINSTFTCHYGFDSTQISPIDYYKVLPTDESISKQSVYENNVLNGTLQFREVYPLPGCVLYCDEKRQKEIPICKTCKIWKRNFFKVKFIFNMDLNNKICREENVSVRCAVGRKNYTYDFSKLPKKKEYNKETTGIWIGIIIGVIVLVGLSILGMLYKFGALKRRLRDTINVENHRGIELNETEQNNRKEEEECLLQAGASNLNTNDSNGQKNAITKPGVKNESTSVQSGHDAVNLIHNQRTIDNIDTCAHVY